MRIDAKVSVIVPTMAAPERVPLLRRAIESVRTSSVHPIRIIVVVNGRRFDGPTCDWLKVQHDVQFQYVETPSLPGAVLRGRELVQTEYFSTLDDDDEYLPGATDLKIAAFHAARNIDFLATNAYRHVDGVDTLMYDSLPAVPGDPLGCLMQFSWLNGDNALYRTESVGVSNLGDAHPFAEWTWLAFKLTMDGKKVSILDTPTCRIHDTAQSLSKSAAYARSYIPLFKRMLDRSPPSRIVQMINRKMSATYHDASVAALREGRRLDAWREHFGSLFNTGGSRYLSYTRHLLK